MYVFLGPAAAACWSSGIALTNQTKLVMIALMRICALGTRACDRKSHFAPQIVHSAGGTHDNHSWPLAFCG
jgi:hypothetical protein